MKKYFVGTIACFILISVTSFTIGKLSNNSEAHANQFSGYLIFTDCTPVNEYHYIGTVSANRVQYIGDLSFADLTYEQLKANLVEVANKNVKKGKMERGDAIIINTTNATGDIIKFKAP